MGSVGSKYSPLADILPVMLMLAASIETAPPPFPPGFGVAQDAQAAAPPEPSLIDFPLALPFATPPGPR